MSPMKTAQSDIRAPTTIRAMAMMISNGFGETYELKANDNSASDVVNQIPTISKPCDVRKW